MDRLEAERERLRRLYDWTLTEIASEVASDFAILRTITGAESAVNILADGDPREVERRCVSLAGISNPHGMRARGLMPSDSEAAEADGLRQAIIRASQARGFFSIFEVERDGKDTVRILRSESREILRISTGAKLYSSGRSSVADITSGDWRLEVMLHHGRRGLEGLETVVRATRSDWPLPYVTHQFAGYARTLVGQRDHWIVRNADDIPQVLGSLRTVLARMISAFEPAVVGLGIAD